MSSNQPTRPKVFVSRSIGDHDFVEKIARGLQRDGVQVWVDEAEMKVGDRLCDEVADLSASGTFCV